MKTKHATTDLFDSDSARTVLGVPGRLTHRVARDEHLWLRQRWISETRPIAGFGDDAVLRVALRFDDECGNGHNTFAVTAEVFGPARRTRRGYYARPADPIACGCLHEEIAHVFPELAGLLCWHLVSTDGPMHYIANTLYHAEARDLAAARKAACWPDAPDEVLMRPREELRALLEARLPGLMAEFRAVMDAIGFAVSPAAFRARVAAAESVTNEHNARIVGGAEQTDPEEAES